MYAIVEVGAKQFKVSKDDIIEVETQTGDKGNEITLDKVLLACDEADKVSVGTPYLKNVLINALVLEQFRGKKTIAFKYRRRKAEHWKKGHRQELTKLQIKDIKIS